MDNVHHFLAMCVLFFALGFHMEGGSCQHIHHFLHRPIPSDILPIVIPKEDPDPVLDPKERDLNETELRAVLGAQFDARYMSVISPEDKREDAVDALHRPTGSMPKEFRALDFDTTNDPKKHNKKLRRRLQNLLWAYSYCPVVHTWQDLGIRFWPRYIKVGNCLNKRSCSIPEGMMCQPANNIFLILLRWHCVMRRGALKCNWISVHYPVISECKCSCRN